MIARFLAPLALVLPGATQAGEPGQWQGVYEGTIGRYPVTVCLQSWGDSSSRGAYYYHSQLKPIRIEAPAAPTRWFEYGEGGSRPTSGGAHWSLKSLGSDTLTGTWREGRRALPITLSQVIEGDADGWPCSSPAFQARRVAPSAFEHTPDALGTFAFTRQTYRTPAHFADVAVESFTFAPTRPGDAAIVRALEHGLPRGTVDDDFIQCIAGALGSLGTDGYWEQTTSPAYVNEAFLAVSDSLGSFCGGAHPNFGSSQRVFDRETGAEIKLESWLSEAAWGETEFDSKPLAPALRELALRHWPDESDPECRKAARDQSYWQFGLSADGFNLTPDFPHVLTACEETATVSWDDLAPYLSRDGKAARSRMP